MKRGEALGKFAEELFKFQPHEVVYIIFDYFACALENKPPIKIEEFFVHFRNGVFEMLKKRKDKE